MANEFFFKKGLAIATASVATASGASQSNRYLVLGDDNIVRNAPAQIAYSIASATSLTFSSTTYNCVDVTALAATMSVSNPTGSPLNFQRLIIRIKDNGTARTLTWDTKFVARGPLLPNTTTAGKFLTLGFIYNSAGTGTWDLVALAQEA